MREDRKFSDNQIQEIIVTIFILIVIAAVFQNPYVNKRACRAPVQK